MSRNGRTLAPPRRLLVIQLRWLGDVLLTTPALRLLRRALPHARIEYLTGAGGAELLRDNPNVDEVLVWRRGTRHDLRLFRRLVGRGYDASIDFQSNPRTALQTLVAHAPVRVGVRGRGPRTKAYTRLFEKEKRGVYMPRQKMELLRGIGIEPPAMPDLDLELHLADEERAWAADMLERSGLADGSPIVALTPTTQHHHKQWGPERWARVSDGLARAGARVLLTYGPGEREQAAAVAARAAEPVVFEEEGTNVRQLAALLERCALWIGNDGGSKHIAVAVGTTTFAVNRHTITDVWTDLRPGSPHGGIERVPVLPCDLVCGRCPHVSCLEQVRVEEVLERTLPLLGSRTPAGGGPGAAEAPVGGGSAPPSPADARGSGGGMRTGGVARRG